MPPTDHPGRTPARISRFRGEHALLSNFHRSPFDWRGHEWPTAEAAFQAAKTHDERVRERIRAAASPAEAKRLGRRVELRPDWERLKDDVMHSILKAKFAVPELRDALLATGDAELVEGNTWGDVYWGVCGGRGRNQLGRTLMRIRDDIRRHAGAATDEQHADWLRGFWDLEGTGRCEREVCRRPSDWPHDAGGQPRPLGAVRTDCDVVEFPHPPIAAQLDAAQEEGCGYGHEHAMESAGERLREDGRLPAATAAIHCLADRHPGLFTDTVRYLFGVDRDIAAAVTESVRLGHALDEPLDAALNAARAAEAAP